MNVIKSLATVAILPIVIGLVFGLLTIVEYWPVSRHNRSAGPKALRVRG